MPTTLEDVRALKSAEHVADGIYKVTSGWDEFAQHVLGKQMSRAADSIGANIAESYGRFNYGEKLQFLYYSRGSLFETKYWLNRALIRKLMQPEDVMDYAARLLEIARQLNSLASSLRAQRKHEKTQSKTVQDLAAEYVMQDELDALPSLFTDPELSWLGS